MKILVLHVSNPLSLLLSETMDAVVTPPADASHELLVTVPGSDHAHLHREICSSLPADPHLLLRLGHIGILQMRRRNSDTGTPALRILSSSRKKCV